jgi:hypothetical protein
MPIYRDVFSRSKDPVFFRTIARELYDLPNGAWRPWEEDIFLPAMQRYSKDYVFSEKERRKLAELCWLSEEACAHDGISVVEMIARCFRYRAEMGYDEDWIIGLAERRAPFVRRRQLRDLVNLYRFTGIDIADVDKSFDRYELEPAS